MIVRFSVVSRYFTLVALLAVAACSRAPDTVYKETAYAMGSIVEFSVYGVDEARAKAAVAAAVDDLNFMNTSLNPWQPGTLARMNALFGLGGKFTAAASVLPLIERGAVLSEKSGGLFNPAIGRLVELWGFNGDILPSGPPPSQAAIDAYLAKLPRMSDIEVSGIEVQSKNPALFLDFGAFAQGYAADRLIERMRDMGVANAIVNISGDVRVIGKRGNQPWRIGIRNPRGEGILASVEMSADESLVTSGDYERFYTYDGKRYHHILDPRTGYPSQGAVSVTVIDPEAAVADAAATALMVAGAKEWYEVAKAMGVKSVMLVDGNGRVHMDPVTAKRVHFETNAPPPVVVSEPL